MVQDYAEAVKWFRLAYAQGDVDAQFSLGLRYALGEGVVQDYKKAHMWINLSAMSGASNTVKARNTVVKGMTTQQIGEAQTMARQCMERKFKGCDSYSGQSMACALGPSGFGVELEGTGAIDIPHRADSTGWPPPKAGKWSPCLIRILFLLNRSLPS